MDLAVTSTTYSNENHSWLGSSHGLDNAEPETMDGDTFLTLFPTGIVPSGVVLGRITASGKVAPYLDSASDGTQTAVGHLAHTVDLHGTTAPTAHDVHCARLWHGQVIEANLPTGHGLDAAGKTDLKQINYV